MADTENIMKAVELGPQSKLGNIEKKTGYLAAFKWSILLPYLLQPQILCFHMPPFMLIAEMLYRRRKGEKQL